MFERIAFYTTVTVIGSLVGCILPSGGIAFVASAIIARPEEQAATNATSAYRA